MPVERGQTRLARTDRRYLAGQLAEVLRGRIMRGDYQPGQCIDTEAAFAEKFGVSRPTVRSAIRELAREGYLWSRQGSGTYVSNPLPRGLPKSPSVGPVLHGFIDDLFAEGSWAYDLDVTRSEVAAPEDIAEQLGCAPGTTVVLIAQVRGRTGLPYGYGEAFLPLEIGGKLPLDLIQSQPTLFHALVEAGFQPREMMHSLEPAVADEPVAGQLGIEPGDPIIRADGVLLSHDRSLLNAYRFFIRQGRGIQVHLIQLGEPRALLEAEPATTRTS